MYKGSPELKYRLSWWWLKAKKENDVWIQLFLYWMMFDAYITEGAGSSIDQKKIKWFVNNDNDVKALIPGYWGGIKGKSSLQILKSSSPLKDMRPDHLGELCCLTDENNVQQVINFIYHIRCNLFHGSKDLFNGRDEALVMSAGSLIKILIDFWSINA